MRAGTDCRSHDFIADLNAVAVARRRELKIGSTKQLDQRDVAGRIDADDHGVIELAVFSPHFMNEPAPDVTW